MSKAPNLHDYNFEVPSHLIAQKPALKRESSKLLSYCAKKNTIEDLNFIQICEQIPQGSLLLFNDTKVFKSRIFTKNKAGTKIEIFVLDVINSKQKDQCHIKALIKPLSKVKENETIYLDNNITATIASKKQQSLTMSSIKLEVNCTKKQFFIWLDKYGHIPLPPYIKRNDDNADIDRYQTIYANQIGSVAAPTAGLHFSETVLERLHKNNITLAPITLHVGLGTFLPIRVENINKHIMHHESYKVPSKTYELILAHNKRKKSVIAIGTTTLRCLESFFIKKNTGNTLSHELLDCWQQTDLFIYPNKNGDIYKPKSIQGLLTNFHQPRSTLFLLICSLLGTEKTKSIYQHALSKKYRMFSYGDACLFWI